MDAIIIGGGAVGLSMALALARRDFKVMVVEQKRPLDADFSNPLAHKTLALSYASSQILKRLGVWSPLKEKAVAITDVDATVQGQFGSCRMKAVDLAVSALGHVVSSAHLEQVLLSALKSLPNMTYCGQMGYEQAIAACDHWTVQINGESYQTPLLIATDGTRSALRQQLNIGAWQRDYQHIAIMANLQLDQGLQGRAVERFLTQGAIALLPWQQQTATCVLTLTPDQAHALSIDDEAAYLQWCADALGERFANQLLVAGKRVKVPLTMQIAHQQSAHRFLLMGNAAHFLHPIAAQGFNLSLKDIWQFYQLIDGASNLGDAQLLAKYVQLRTPEQKRMIAITDKIARYMSGGPLPMWLRAKGMTSFDSLFPVKQQLTRYFMGALCG